MEKQQIFQQQTSPLILMFAQIFEKIQITKPLNQFLQNIQKIEIQEEQVENSEIKLKESFYLNKQRKLQQQQNNHQENYANEFISEQKNQTVNPIEKIDNLTQTNLQKIHQNNKNKQNVQINKKRQSQLIKQVCHQELNRITDKMLENQGNALQNNENQQKKQFLKNNQLQLIQQVSRQELNNLIDKVVSNQNTAFYDLLNNIENIQIQQQNNQIKISSQQNTQTRQQKQKFKTSNYQFKQETIEKQNVQHYQNQKRNEQNNRNVINSQKLKQVQKQIQKIKNKQTDQYINAKLQENLLKKKLLEKTISILSKHHNQSIKNGYQIFKNLNQSSFTKDQNDRIKLTSSRKLNSSSSKRKSDYEISQELNLQLTIQSKNSKNFMNFSKQDSLTYSKGSDFGIVLEKSISPLKKKGFDIEDSVKSINYENTSSNKILRKIEDQGDLLQELSNIISIKKSQSKQIIQKPLDTQTKQISQNVSYLTDRQHTHIDDYSVTQQIHIPENSNSINEEYNRFENDYQQSALISQSLNLQKEKKRVNSLSRKRVDTQIEKPLKRNHKSRQSFKKFNKIQQSRFTQSNQNTNIFSSQINNYQLRIAKIKQSKLLKRKKLQEQLVKVNRQIDDLNNKQEQLSPQVKPDFANRNEISNDKQALTKAENLVKNLRYQKKHRQIAKINQFKNLDKNINEYMIQLSKMREKNQIKLKQKKKIQILQRMKQKQIKKAFDRKKQIDSINFVLHLKSPYKHHEQEEKQSPSSRKKSEHFEQNQTPELSQKKAYLSKVRNISVKKTKLNVYEQFLG